MKSGLEADDLKKALAFRFACVWQRCRLDSSDASPDAAWEDLARRYSESHRLYHTLEHIAWCLHEFDSASALMNNPDIIELAIWYHDIINAPNATDNELQSQQLFARVAQGVFESEFIRKVGDLILITTHRQVPKTQDEQYVCDIDLSSMGAPWYQFIEDCDALRAESETSKLDYTLGKLKFFNSLLERPKIFYSEFFYNRFEQSARGNIQRYKLILQQH